jgi:hypothetical protein
MMTHMNPETQTSDETPIVVLMLSIGSLVGTAALECMEMIGRERFVCIGLNSIANSGNNFRCDVCYLSPDIADQASLFRLLDEVVAKHLPDIIVPGRDDDVVALAQWKAAGGSAKTMVGCVGIAQMIRDKWKSYCWARKHRLPFAESAIDAAGVANLRKRFGLPLVAKPRLGFGSNGVRILATDHHVERALKRPDTVVQQAISPSPTMPLDILDDGIPLWYAPVQPGSPLAISLLDDKGSHFVSISQSQHVRGAAINNCLVDLPDLERTLMQFSDAAWGEGWRGLFSIQARPNVDGDYVPIELAGRFMGATSALQALGTPVFERVIAAYVPRYKITSKRAGDHGLRVTKQVGVQVHRQSDEQALLSTGRWVSECALTRRLPS